MGMEGKLRQVSAFELAAYRNNPEKFYCELISRHSSGDIANFTSAMMQLQQSPLAQRIHDRAASGKMPIQADVDEFRGQKEVVRSRNKEVVEQLQSKVMGLSKDGLQLSLYKDWHIIHCALTGKIGSPRSLL
jgi:hypothetical protein